MKQNYIEVTREDLYQRVWKETLRDIVNTPFLKQPNRRIIMPH